MNYRKLSDIGIALGDILHFRTWHGGWDNPLKRAAAEAFRKEIQEARGNETPLFHRSGNLDDLTACYEQKTGLAPTTPKVFPNWVRKG